MLHRHRAALMPRIIRPVEGPIATVPLEAGNAAPPLTTTYSDQEGTEHTLSEHLSEGPLVIGLYKASCVASKAMMPLLNRLQDRYAGDSLHVYGVAQDSANVTKSFVRRTGVNYPILIEGEEYPLSRAFDIFATPTVYVIDKDGEITYSTMGFLRDQVNDISAALAAALGREAETIVSDDEEEIPRFVPG
jgi:thiol-disulfide isomerase/thioredoxin